ncbi:hypothetical protein [Rhodococcus rhodnii]|uniref:hypothetical protein n=1 Tax=Rhodococcus rhodnii TaxID=38312 RepID=UPI000A438113|nr:hypothetical protein [Rhodococcus rhodnii]
MNEQLRRIVDETYRTSIGVDPSWTDEQTRVFVDQETARLNQRITLLAEQIQDETIATYVRDHDRQPDFTVHVDLVNQAKEIARETVLTSELYRLIASEETETLDLLDPQVSATTADLMAYRPPAEALDAARTNPDRWRTVYRSEPTPEIDAAVAAIWPERTGYFRIKAQYLLQTRAEDLQPLPSGPSDPLADELAALVIEDLRADGLPLDG